MVITAVIGVRNESKYLPITLKHLVESNIKIAIIDNDSNDNIEKILNDFKNHIVLYQRLPYNGFFSLTEQINIKNEIIDKLETDWVIHQDADEILESPLSNENLRRGIERVTMNGCNAINFNEFVFVPTTQNPNFEDSNFLESMLSYYFFEPYPFRLMRAWKKESGFKLIEGGHEIESINKTIFSEESFVLRHYMVLSYNHAVNKYLNRIFAKEDISKGWHKKRLNFPLSFSLPNEDSLKRLSQWNSKEWDLSCPLKNHFWEFLL
jgi:glycosyltransferase involved in cell wall biosynthesis